VDSLLEPRSDEFRLSPGDVIQVRFFYNPELDDTIQIRPDGMISMPLVGELGLDNLTVTEARKRLEDLYRTIVKQPSVTIQVREYATQKIYVGGQVLRPGVIPMKGELTVLDAVMEAGGNRLTGSNSTVVLIRKSETGEPERYKLSLKGKGDQPPMASVKLQPFDIVLVPETTIARIDRWVDQHVRQLIPVVLTAGFTYLKTTDPVIIP
jgi:protein involved in polysaccharide export with SLBB domain